MAEPLRPALRARRILLAVDVRLPARGAHRTVCRTALSLILRLSRPVSFGYALAGFVVVDYALYIFFNSQKPVGAHGLWHEIIGLAVLGLLFHGRIRPIFTRKVRLVSRKTGLCSFGPFL